MGQFTQILTEDWIEVLCQATPLHDIGKVTISDHILNKDGKLSQADWCVMQTHAQMGEAILATTAAQLEDTSPVLKMAIIVAGYHHEKWDGSGYPKGLSGNEIAISSRIVAIADVFDALTSKRPYKEAWPLDKAFAHLQANAGTHFDPELIEVFLGLKTEIAEVQLRWAEP
jgi:putative two-component system response regulator